MQDKIIKLFYDGEIRTVAGGYVVPPDILKYALEVMGMPDLFDFIMILKMGVEE